MPNGPKLTASGKQFLFRIFFISFDKRLCKRLIDTIIFYLDLYRDGGFDSKSSPLFFCYVAENKDLPNV